MKNPVRMLAVFLAPFAVASTTWGHATFENREVVQNTTVRMVTRVSHGCSGQPTLRVRIAIPEGVVGVKPMPKAGWTLTTKTIQLSQPSRATAKRSPREWARSHGRESSKTLTMTSSSLGQISPIGYLPERCSTFPSYKNAPTVQSDGSKFPRTAKVAVISNIPHRA